MANDRMYMYCAECNECLYLGKHLMSGWYDLQKLDFDYLGAHFWCWPDQLPLLVGETGLNADTAYFKSKEHCIVVPRNKSNPEVENQAPVVQGGLNSDVHVGHESEENEAQDVPDEPDEAQPEVLDDEYSELDEPVD